MALKKPKATEELKQNPQADQPDDAKKTRAKSKAAPKKSQSGTKVKSSKNAGMANGFHAMTPTQYAAMMQGVDRVYDRFTSIVAQGRNLTQERVF